MSEIVISIIYFLGSSGVIELRDYGYDVTEQWYIHSDCKNVKITSQYFHTEPPYDTLTIDGRMYSGEWNITQVVGGSFTVVFTADISRVPFFTPIFLHQFFYTNFFTPNFRKIFFFLKIWCKKILKNGVKKICVKNTPGDPFPGQFFSESFPSEKGFSYKPGNLFPGQLPFSGTHFVLI